MQTTTLPAPDRIVNAFGAVSPIAKAGTTTRDEYKPAAFTKLAKIPERPSGSSDTKYAKALQEIHQLQEGPILAPLSEIYRVTSTENDLVLGQDAGELVTNLTGMLKTAFESLNTTIKSIISLGIDLNEPVKDADANSSDSTLTYKYYFSKLGEILKGIERVIFYAGDNSLDRLLDDTQKDGLRTDKASIQSTREAVSEFLQRDI